MNSDIETLVAVARTYREHHELFARLRREHIRDSDIVRDGPAFNLALASAKYLGYKKPMTGLIQLRELLTEMNG